MQNYLLCSVPPQTVWNQLGGEEKKGKASRPSSFKHNIWEIWISEFYSQFAFVFLKNVIHKYTCLSASKLVHKVCIYDFWYNSNKKAFSPDETILSSCNIFIFWCTGLIAVSPKIYTYIFRVCGIGSGNVRQASGKGDEWFESFWLLPLRP